MDRHKLSTRPENGLKRLVLWVGVLGAVIGLQACSDNSNNYRVTATVDVNGKEYSGSSVQKWACHEGANWASGMDVSRCTVKGEAVVVDLKERGYLFLIFQGRSHDYVESFLRARGQNPYGPAQQGMANSWNLKTDDIPTLVWFENINDPKSIREADPGNLKAAFGDGVTLKTVTAENTDDPVTSGVVVKALPWIGTIKTLFDGKNAISTNYMSSRMDRSYFIREK